MRRKMSEKFYNLHLAVGANVIGKFFTHTQQMINSAIFVWMGRWLIANAIGGAVMRFNSHFHNLIKGSFAWRLITCLQHVHCLDGRLTVSGHVSAWAQVKLVAVVSFDGEKLFVIHFSVFIILSPSIWEWKTSAQNTFTPNFPNFSSLDLSDAIRFRLHNPREGLLTLAKKNCWKFHANLSLPKWTKGKMAEDWNLGWNDWKKFLWCEKFPLKAKSIEPAQAHAKAKLCCRFPIVCVLTTFHLMSNSGFSLDGSESNLAGIRSGNDMIK